MDDIVNVVTMDPQAPVPDQLTKGSLESLVSHVLDQEGVSEEWNLAFRFTSSQNIEWMHLEFMGIDSPTDILTFPYQSPEDAVFGDIAQNVVGGDIVISVDQASVQAVDAGWSTLDELYFLSIHGMLHLLGWNDHDAEARSGMLERQCDLLNTWKAENH